MTKQKLALFYKYMGWTVDDYFYEVEEGLSNHDLIDEMIFHPVLQEVNPFEVDYLIETVSEIFEGYKEKGIHVTFPQDEHYPKSFYSLAEPPSFLTYKGQPTWNNHQLISVVGSREPTFTALEWMEKELCEVLGPSVGVVSGAARGVDQKAHQLALLKGSPTYAFLPSGLDEVYPSRFTEYVDEICAQGGAVLSEYLIDQKMEKGHFQQRNRLISAMGSLVLVVQAKIKSGSLLTARHALSTGQTVCAVPWGPLEAGATGTNQLLFDGAQMVRDADDLKSLMSLCQFSPTPASLTRH